MTIRETLIFLKKLQIYMMAGRVRLEEAKMDNFCHSSLRCASLFVLDREQQYQNVLVPWDSIRFRPRPS